MRKEKTSVLSVSSVAKKKEVRENLCNLYYYIAKPCFHYKIFPPAFAYSRSNNRLGMPSPPCNLWLKKG